MLRYHRIIRIFLLAGVVHGHLAAADGTMPPSVFEKTATSQATETEFVLPEGFPTAGEVLRMKFKESHPKVKRARCELMQVSIGGLRFYPMVGPARLVQGRFKYTVIDGGRPEVTFVEIKKLLVDQNTIVEGYGTE